MPGVISWPMADSLDPGVPGPRLRFFLQLLHPKISASSLYERAPVIDPDLRFSIVFHIENFDLWCAQRKSFMGSSHVMHIVYLAVGSFFPVKIGPVP